MAKDRRAKQRFRGVPAATKASSGEAVESVVWKVRTKAGNPVAIEFSDSATTTAQTLNVSRWCAIGPLAKSIAVWYAKSHKNLSHASRDTGARQITDGFVSFAVSERIKLSKPEEITTNLINRFLTYLDTKIRDDGKNLSLSTRMHYWSSVKRLLRTAVNDINHGRTVLHIPHAPFAGRKPHVAQMKEADPKELAALLSVCGKSALETMDRVMPSLVRIKEKLPRIKVNVVPGSMRVADAATYFIKKYQGLLPERKWLLRHENEDFLSAERVGYSRIREAMHPELQDLVPFLYILAGFTAFNQQPLFTLKISQYNETTLAGKSKFQISPLKTRSNSIVRRSFDVTDDALSPRNILAFLELWTEPLRREAPKHMKADVFLIANKWKSRKPCKSLAEPGTAQSREFTNTAMRYFKAKGVRYMGLREIRYTYSELFRRLRPGDSDGLRVLLGQKMVDTTDGHYRTKRAQKEAGEALAGVMLAHQRMVESGTKADIRKVPEHRERTAATPGFACLDPLDSPIAGQRRGRLCWAYGRCPECPLAMLDPDEAYALARLLQLRDRYAEARRRLGTIIFKEKYGISAKALREKWLAAGWSKAALEKAERLYLGDLPKLE